jgi:hypothetical protein
MGDGTFVHAQMGAYGIIEWGSPGWRSAVELREELRSLHRDVTRVEKRIHDINRQFLERLDTVVAVDAAEEVRRGFLRRAYPGVYPDPTNLDEVVSAALAIEELTIEQRDAIRALADDDEARRRMICDRMVRHFLAWRAFFATEQTQGTIEWDEYEQAMTADWTERAARAKSTVAEIVRILDANIDGATTGAIGRVHDEIRADTLVLEPMFGHRRARRR